MPWNWGLRVADSTRKGGEVVASGRGIHVRAEHESVVMHWKARVRLQVALIQGVRW